MKEHYHDAYTFTRFDTICAKAAERTALYYLGEKYTYGRLSAMIDRFAAGLVAIGVKPQDRVMIYIPNCPQWIIANFAINKIGAVMVPVSPIYTAYEIGYMVEDADIRTLICLDTNFVYVREVMQKTRLERVIVTNLVELVVPWKRVLGRLFDKIPTGRIERDKNIYSFTGVMKEGKAQLPEVEMDPWEDLAYIMYTGGTTGFPKGVPGNHMGEVSYITDVMEDVIGDHMEEGKEVVLMVNPLFHIMAKGFTIAFGFNYGNTVVLMPSPEIDATLKAIERYKVGWMLGVPALYRMILENDRIDQYDLSSLKYCYCGGDVLPAEVYKSWHQRYHVPIYQVYGSTEAGHVTYSLLDKEPKPTVVGTPLKSRKCMLADQESLKAVPEGEVGELLVTSPFTIKSYWKKPEETVRSFVRQNGDIYYRMGDFMKLNEDGDLEFMERTADTIKYKAYRISASEIEAVLQDHPTVIGACCVGIPDSRVGERIKAIVVLKEDAKGVGSSELTRWCRDRLAPYKIPHYIEFRDMLPKSKVGKLLRREIRDEEKRKLEKEKRKAAH
jgi:long-chain acyl-CoA synthetase